MKQPLSFFNVSLKNESSDSVDINIDGYIVDAPTQEMMKQWFGDETSVSFKSVRDEITKVSPKNINVYINSGGGALFEAMAIHDFLISLENKGTVVNRYGLGIIGSAATLILMGKNSHISENSWFMIHNASMGVYGNVNEVESAAKSLRKFNDQVVQLYSDYTGKPKETISSWMNKETWFSGKEAVENGFVQNTTGKAEFTNSIKPETWPFSNTHVLNAYNSQVKNSDMKIEFSSIKDAVKNALVEMGFSKKEDEPKIEEATNKIVTAIENSLKPLTENFDESVKNSLQALLKETGEGTVAGAIQNAVNTATATVATKEEVTKVENKITELAKNVTQKLGGAAPEPDETKRKITDKKSFFQVGTFE